MGARLCMKCKRAVPSGPPYATAGGRLVGVEVCSCGASFGLVLTPEERARRAMGTRRTYAASRCLRTWLARGTRKRYAFERRSSDCSRRVAS